MSYDLFVGCFVDGEKARFPRERLESYFGPYITRREQNCSTLDFGAHGTSYLYCADQIQIDGFSINRPVGAPELFQALFDALRAGPLVLFAPGDCPPLIGDAQHSVHVPAAMVAALGTPVVLRSAAEILQRIATA
ncbi:MAG TPA: hypothetical protein VGE92_15665 [Steroidobacteraceae bacterium]